jgi:hypothetical protein
MRKDPQACGVFQSLARITVGDGKLVQFWTDRWINGCTAEEIAPEIVQMVSKRRRNNRSVYEATLNNNWVVDVAGELTIENYTQCIRLWEQIDAVHRDGQEPGKFTWTGAPSGQYSAKSTYEMLCEGSITCRTHKQVWKSAATPTVKLFCWLALRYRLWTSDR